MKALNPKRFVLVLISACVLTSCGGGGGGMNAGGGIDGSGFIAQGSISAFGSVFVNGTEFDTSNAAVIIKGEQIGIGDVILRDNLDIGRVVTVEGRRTGDPDTVVADRILYSDNVEGPVSSIHTVDNITKEIIVLGQTVVVHAVTTFKDTTYDTIAVDDIVEVSGFVDDTGAVRATFIRKTGVFSPGVVVEVKGYVMNLDTIIKTFRVNDLTVDYSMADMSSLPGGIPVNGMRIEIEGTLDAAGDVLDATQIRLDDDLSVVDSNEIEVMGFVTDFVSLAEFTIGNQRVQTDAGTLFTDGAPEDVQRGIKLEAEGTLVNGVLIAKEIEFWGANQIEVEGLVTSIVSISEFTVGSQAVQTKANTVFVDGAPGDVALGVKLEIKGVPVDAARSILVADKVSFESP